MKREIIVNKFIVGIIVLLPVLLSLYLTIWILNFLLNIINFNNTNNDLLGNILMLFVLIISIFITGIISSTKPGEKIISKMDITISKIPILNKFYSFFKQLIETIYFKKIKTYKKVVIVEYPQRYNYAIGFLTSEVPQVINEIVGNNCFNIFIPTTPNPTSGMLILFPENKIYKIDMSIEDALKYIVSGGLAVNKFGHGG